MAEDQAAYAAHNSGNAGQSNSEAVNGNVQKDVSEIRFLNGVEITFNAGEPVKFVFPDGVSYERNLEKFPNHNGYNPVYFSSDGSVRFTTDAEFNYLKTKIPEALRDEYFYRKDYLNSLDRLNNISRDADGAIIRDVKKPQKENSLGIVVPYITPNNFGTDEWNAEKLAAVRIWRGFDGLTKTARFPDGTTFKRDMNKWPMSNGYNPAVFTINGEVRLTSLEDLSNLVRLNPMVNPENVVYRKDFIDYMDYEMGILRDSDGKIINVRPDADRGKYDQIINGGLNGVALAEAKERNIRDAAEIAESIADSDRHMTDLMSYVNGKKIGYHGEVDSDRDWQSEYNREKVLDSLRLYPQNDDTEFALKELQDGHVSDVALDILAQNFNSNDLCESYVAVRLVEHYDSLGEFYTNQLKSSEVLSADISSYAAKDALKGAYVRESLEEVGYGMANLRRMSTKGVVSEFNSCIEKGIIEQTKGGNLDMAMYKASQKQCSYISQNWEAMYLPSNFTDKYSRKDVALDAMKTEDSVRKVEYIDAKEAFAFNSLMIHLKPYVTDKKLEQITTAREALNECKKYYANIDINASPAVFEGGKVNKLQAKELKSHGEDPKSYATYEEAKAKIETFEPTKEQVKAALKFMKEEDINKLNRGELDKVIRENKKAYAEHMHSEVSTEIRAMVEKSLGVTKEQQYTYGDWARDSFAVPPSRQQLGYIHKNILENTVEWYAKSQAERGNKKFLDANGEVVHSYALYEAVKNFHERKVSEKQNGPMDDFQKKFFKDHGWEMGPETTWKQANEAMLTTAYLEGLVGKANNKFMQDNSIAMPSELREKLFKYDMTDAERKQVREEVNEACNEARKILRLAKIESVSIIDTSVYGSARNFVNDYMVSHKGNLKGVEDAMFKGYAEGKITFPDEHMVAEKGGIPSLAVGHVMASVLPNCVGDYNKALERFSDGYEAALGAREKGMSSKTSQSNSGEER